MGERQLAYAAAGALNDTAVDFQIQEFLHEKDIFTLRRPDWVQKSNKITHFAKKYEGELYTTVTLSPPGANERSDIVGKFEDQTTKQSRNPGGMVAIPINARKGKRDIVVPSQRPCAFNFRQTGNRIVGDRGTFIVKLANGKQLILQRTGRGVQALYELVPQVHITPDLEYLKTARWTAENKFEANFARRWARALETAK